VPAGSALPSVIRRNHHLDWMSRVSEHVFEASAPRHAGQGEEKQMAKVGITEEEVGLVARLLQDIEAGADVPNNLRANAALWAVRMEPSMDRRDLQRVAWLLKSASKTGMPRGERRRARRWAAQLQARI
jgi:uncharacterized protein (UPF0147 family)